MADDVAPEIPARMLPKLDEHNRTFWTGGADGQLHIAWCDRCRLWVQPPGADCPDCGGAAGRPPGVGPRQRLHLHGELPSLHAELAVPYVIAIVELEEQADLRIATNIVGCEPDSVYVGMPVEVRFERHEVDGGTVYFPVFAPRA